MKYIILKVYHVWQKICWESGQVLWYPITCNKFEPIVLIFLGSQPNFYFGSYSNLRKSHLSYIQEVWLCFEVRFITKLSFMERSGWYFLTISSILCMYFRPLQRMCFGMFLAGVSFLMAGFLQLEIQVWKSEKVEGILVAFAHCSIDM
jgi:hypothetical protein